MKDLHIKLCNTTAQWLEEIKIESCNMIRDLDYYPGLSNLPYKSIKTTDTIEAMIELVWNCMCNKDSMTINDPEDTFVREVIAQAIYNRL